jgi:hypothetical protein
MPIGARQKKTQHEKPVITGTWSAPTPEEAVTVVSDVPEEEERTAAFVKLNTMVGRYPQGSILPASAFEYIDNLLNLGAVEYDFDATDEFIAGNREHVDLLASVQQSSARIIPQAPWVNASPQNLLGATYIPLLLSQQQFSPSPVSAPIEPTVTLTVEDKPTPVVEATVTNPFPDTSS